MSLSVVLHLCVSVHVCLPACVCLLPALCRGVCLQKSYWQERQELAVEEEEEEEVFIPHNKKKKPLCSAKRHRERQTNTEGERQRERANPWDRLKQMGADCFSPILIQLKLLPPNDLLSSAFKSRSKHLCGNPHRSASCTPRNVPALLRTHSETDRPLA